MSSPARSFDVRKGFWGFDKHATVGVLLRDIVRGGWTGTSQGDRPSVNSVNELFRGVCHFVFLRVVCHTCIIAQLVPFVNTTFCSFWLFLQLLFCTMCGCKPRLIRCESLRQFLRRIAESWGRWFWYCVVWCCVSYKYYTIYVVICQQCCVRFPERISKYLPIDVTRYCQRTYVTAGGPLSP